jgi:hypothetical protein
VRLEGLGQLKNPVTSSGIKPLRLVAQCLNQLRYRVPPFLVFCVVRVVSKEDGWFFQELHFKFRMLSLLLLSGKINEILVGPLELRNPICGPAMEISWTRWSHRDIFHAAPR